MNVTIRPKKLQGTVAAPPSKSMAHRLLICGGLSCGTSIIRNVAMSQDILATLDCLAALGATYRVEQEVVTITGCDPRKAEGASLPCRECGSTLRFMIPLCLLSGERFSLYGSHRLLERPLGIYETICREQALPYERTEDHLEVAGVLSPGAYEVPGNVSSQFISGLLFALPLLKEDSVIRLLPPIESRPYIDMTLEALRTFGIRADWKSETEIAVTGNQSYTPADITVEGDYSNAAFLEALNLVGGSVEVTGLSADSLQGDKVYRTYYEELKKGCATLNLEDCPDLGPVLFAVAALLKGGHFTGTRRLRIKESDRAACMQKELEKFGVSMEVEENRVRIYPGELQPPKTRLDGHNDHRIVMALAVVATVLGGTITGAEAINKSFPDFFDRLRSLGAEVEIDGMDK